MSGPAADVESIARLLLDLAARAQDGRVALGGRTFVLRAGELLDVSPSPTDESFEQFLVKTGRIGTPELGQYQKAAERERVELTALLVQHAVVSEADLTQIRRAILLDRAGRAWLAAAAQGAPVPKLEALGSVQDGAPALPLLPVVLDVLTRIAANEDTSAVSSSLNHRIEWSRTPQSEAARKWAAFGDVPERPAVSTVLAKHPAAAPRIAALLRAGLVRLDATGRAGSSGRPAPDTIPPPPARSSVIPPPGTPLRHGQDPLKELASLRPPRLRLDPGSASFQAEPIEPTLLPAIERGSLTADDPLAPIEARVAELEAASAPGPERARAFATLAAAFRDRYHSVERACLAMREAAAADPTDTALLQQAALLCHDLGQSELASRYAASAVAAATLPLERAAAQRLRASIERAAGNLDACVEALCEAAADEPGSADPHEQVAALLLARNNVEGANAHARLAAAALQDADPPRALAMLGWAWWLAPHDVPTAYEYASALDADGRRLAAVAVLSETAQRTSDPNHRRKLRLAAAQRAEAAHRPAFASELLLDAFDAEPHFDLLYGPLDEDLSTLSFREYRAAVLEDIATACPAEQRAHWLTAAGHAVQASGHQEAALWLFYEAVLTQPRDPSALEALREHAKGPREHALLAHALRAAIAGHIGHDGETAKRLLRELAEFAERPLANPHLAQAAWIQLQRLGSSDLAALDEALSRLGNALDERRAALTSAEAELAAAPASQRAERGYRVARLLPDLPEQWPRAIELLRAALDAGVEASAARAALETLLGLRRDAIALATFLEDQLDREQDPGERLRLSLRLSAVHSVREDTAAVASACEHALAADPQCRLALARYERATRRLGDYRRIARALAMRNQLAVEPLEQARVLAQLARCEELIGQYPGATAHAALALELDPAAADAALLILRRAHGLAPPDALRCLDVCAVTLGGSRALYATVAAIADSVRDRPRAIAAIESWIRLFPHDGTAHRLHIEALTADAGARALLEGCEAALTAIPDSEVLTAARAAVERLHALGALEMAAGLGLRVAAHGGRPDPVLAARCVALARASGNRELMVRALELNAAFAPEEQRADALLELAAHHRERKDAAAELRALARVLEARRQDAQALDRLRVLLGQLGDVARLHGVLAALLDAESDPARRRSLLLSLIGITGRELGDLERAEFYVRTLLAENADDPGRTREALGALFSIGEAEWAIGRCEAIAEICPPELGSRIYAYCTATAELRLGNSTLALALARRGALRWRSLAELLLAVERLTLATDDVATAMDTYDALIEAAIGPHGRRALLYRAGRWLERAGRLDQALERYLEAFEYAPTTGAAFKAIERVARQTGRTRRILGCYERLAELAREDRARFALLRKAGELCFDEVGEPGRAFDLLLRANAVSERHVLDARLLEVARCLTESDPRRGSEAFERLISALDQRTEQIWSAEDKVRSLAWTAKVCTAAGDVERARARLEVALELARAEAPLPALLADVLSETAGVAIAAGEFAAAQSAIDEATTYAPDHERARELRSELSARLVTRRSTPLPPRSSSVPPRAPSQAPRAPSQPPRSPVSPALTSAGPSGVETQEGRAALLVELREGPIRTSTLRALMELCTPRDQRAELHVLRQIVSTFDSAVTAATDPAFHSGLWRGRALPDAIGPVSSAEAIRVLGMLWEYARVIPRYRRGLGAFGVAERDRITRITVGPVAEAYAQAARMLGATDVPVYVTRNNGAPARALPTHPPAVQAGRGVALEATALLYTMAHALWLADSPHVIGGVLGREDAVDLLEAARVAFVPPDATRTPTAAVKELAAALWQAVPMREQKQIADALRVRREELAYPQVRARVRAGAARAALLSSGGLAAALRLLPVMETELAGVDLSSEQAFEHACEVSPALADSVRCALSAHYLDALRHVL